MDPFDPAINYGPNDAGVSAFTITAVIISILIVSWAFGAIYSLITNFLSKKDDSGN